MKLVAIEKASLSQPVDLTMDVNDSDFKRYYAIIGDLYLKVRFIEDYKHIWEITFSTGKDDSPYNQSFKLTNTGKAQVVFATVIAAIRMFVKKYEFDLLLFSAKEASRAKLYARLLKIAEKESGLKTTSFVNRYKDTVFILYHPSKTNVLEAYKADMVD